VKPGDRIILCTAKEVDSGRKGTEIHSDRDVEFLERSKRLRKRIWLLAPYNLPLAGVFGAVQLLLALMLGLHLKDVDAPSRDARGWVRVGAASVTPATSASLAPTHVSDRHVALGLGDLLNTAWESPTFFLLILLVIMSLVRMVRFAHDARGIRRFLVGTVHTALQLVSAAGFMIASSWLSSAFGLRGCGPWSPSSA